MMTKKQYDVLYWFSLAAAMFLFVKGETVGGIGFMITAAIYLVGKDISERLQALK